MKKSGFAKGVFWTLSIGIILVVVLIVGALMWYSYAPPFEASYSSDGKSREAKIKIEKKDKVSSEIASVDKKQVKFNEDLLKDKIKLNFKQSGPFYGIKENGRMVRGIYKLPKNDTAKTDYYGLFTKDEMFWKGYSKHTYNDGKITYQYNEYQLDSEGRVIQLDNEGNRVFKNGIFQIVDSYLITADDFEKVKKYIRYDIQIPFKLYDFDTQNNTLAKEKNQKNVTQVFSSKNQEKIKIKINSSKKYCLYEYSDGSKKIRSHESMTMEATNQCPKPLPGGRWVEISYSDFKKLNNIKDPKIKLEMVAKVFDLTYSDSDQTTTFSVYSEIKTIDPNELENFYIFFNNVFNKTIQKCEKMNQAFTDGECKISSVKIFNFNDETENKTFTKINGFNKNLNWIDLINPDTTAIAKSNNEEKFISDEKYYALVIGNNNYEHLEKLDAAENDAEVIADVLTNKYGFEVDLLLNADYDTTVNSLFKITNKLKRNDNLLIYYAGHGELDKAENRGYWLPVDASYELRSKWISNQRIVDRVKATKAKHVLLMVDSCFSGSLMRGGELSEDNETIDKKYIERLKNKKTRLVITSGGNEPVVDSDGGNHSLFALKLIDTLKNNDNVINSQILFENIRRYVVANADQTPERAMVHKTGHDGGDFLFFPKK